MRPFSPPYDVVQDSKKIGMYKPEDNLWVAIGKCKLNGPYIYVQCDCASGLIESLTSKKLKLKGYRWPNKYVYWLGQCPKCHKVFWKKGRYKDDPED